MNLISKYRVISLLLIGFSFIARAETTRFSLPDYQQLTLDNGLTVYLMEQHEVPTIDVNIVVNAGAVEDRKQAGLAQATAQGLMFGTEKLSKKALEQFLEFRGAEVGADASLEYSALNASFLARDSKDVLPVLADLIQRPVFNEEEFTKHQKRHIDELMQRKESPESVATDYFHQMIYADSPYSNIVDGTQDSVKQLTIQSLWQYYHSFYRPENTAVIMVGAFDSKDMLQQIKSLFGSWKGKTLESEMLQKVSLNRPAKLTQSRVLLVNKSDSRQSTFYIGGHGIEYSNKEYIPLFVVNTILGGRFTSWLNDELRVNAGLTYGARSRFNVHKVAGSFHISTFTDTRTTEDAIDLALKTYARLWEKGIDAETLESAKAYVKGQFPPKFETSEQLASLLQGMFIYGYDKDFINQFQDKVDSLTLKKTKELINTYFPQDNLQFMVIGKGDEIRDVLKKYGKVTEVDINQVGFEVAL